MMFAATQPHWETFMRTRITTVLLLGLSAALLGATGGMMGDSTYGRVTAVKSANTVVFAHAAGEYNLRIAGIDVPRHTRAASAAADFVRSLVLGKDARIRLERRLPNGQLLVRLFTADSSTGIRDVAVELVRAGFVQHQANYDYKYGELSAAENEARKARRGLWANRR
jgi:endonuclease YncB( thermonuclease family)